MKIKSFFILLVLVILYFFFSNQNKDKNSFIDSKSIITKKEELSKLSLSSIHYKKKIKILKNKKSIEIINRKNCQKMINHFSLNEIFNKYNKQYDQVIDVKKVHFEFEGKKVRLTWRIEISPEGKKNEIMQYFTLDDEDLPIPTKLPMIFSGKKWEEIEKDLNHVEMVINEGYFKNTDISFRRENNITLEFNSKDLYCTNSRCVCLTQ